MSGVLWLCAVILAVCGVLAILRGAVLAGVALLVVACLVGPGGVSLYNG